MNLDEAWRKYQQDVEEVRQMFLAELIIQENPTAAAAPISLLHQTIGMEEHFHDVHFRALIAEPIATVREIYQRFELPLSEAVVQRMEHWLANDDSHAVKARYTLEQLVLSKRKWMRHSRLI